MFKKILATFATLLLAAGLSVVAVAAPASAHTPTVVASCDNLAVTLTGYETKQGNSKPNSIIVTVDGAQVLNTTFGASLAKQTFAYDGTKTHTWTVVIDAIGGTKDTQYDVNQSGTTTACVLPPTQGTNTVDCSAATIYTGRQLTNGDHINMDITQGGVKFQLNAAVDIRQSQDPASESGLVIRIHQKTGPDITLPVTNAQKQTGSFSFVYSTYLTGTWTVEWVQFNSSYFNQDRTAGKFIKCGTDPKDATATVSATTPTCDAAATLTLGTVVNATWGTPVYDGSNYSVVATATDGHLFDDGQKTKTFTGTLAGKSTTGCAVPPTCLPRSAVTYTYDPATNSGNVSVKNPDATKYTNELCQGFWVTASSWFYTTNDVWPQIRNQVNKLDKITTVGEYPYNADVVCGQGDIYASFIAQPDPTFNLYGPSNPFPETFLHNMGFGTSTPGNTYTQTATGCNQAPVVEPTVKKITECGTYGSIVVPADTASIDYTLVGNGTTGIQTVTAVAIAPYVLKNYPAGGWSFNLGAYTDCPVQITATYVPACTPDDTATFKVYNPSEDSVVVTYPGGTHTATPGYSTFDTTFGSRSITLTWGEANSGVSPGSYEARIGTDLSADDPACIKLAEPVEPTLTTASECGVYGTVTATDTDAIDYTVEFDQQTGDYTVTATPKFGYYFADDKTSVVYEGNVGAYVACVEKPDATVAYGECTYNLDGTANFRAVSITFDNTGSNKPVFFEVPYFAEYNQTVPAGQKVTFQVANMYALGGGYQVKAAGQTFELTIPPCDLPTLPEPKVWEEPTESFECTDTQVTISTITYTQGWVFDTDAVEWVEGPIEASEPVISYRDVTADDVTAAGCVQTVTDPEASTCENITDATDLTSWIRIVLDPNVKYSIDGVEVTSEYNAVTPGEHTVTADALNGYTLSGGNPDKWTDTHHEWTFTAVDSAVDCLPTQPTIEGSTAAGECVANAPWIFFNVKLTDPDGIATSNEAHLIMDDGTNSANIDLGLLVEDPANPGTFILSGKVLWPGAAVGPDGVTPTAWPGWEQVDGKWVETTGNFAWTRTLDHVTLSVNPQIVVSLEYPPATPDCVSGPPTDPPTLATVTPAFSTTPLTCSAAGSYTLGELTPGTVQWTVNGNKVDVGTYPVTSAQTLTFVAAPLNPEDGLDEDWVQPEPVSFTTGAVPCVITALASTGGTASFGLIWIALLLGLTGVGFVLIRRRTATEK